MILRLGVRDRLRLRTAALAGPTRAVRLRSVILLHLADGVPLARLAAAAGVSRPTVYQWARVFGLRGRPADLESRGIGRRDRQAIERAAERRRADPGA